MAITGEDDQLLHVVPHAVVTFPFGTRENRRLGLCGCTRIGGEDPGPSARKSGRSVEAVRRPSAAGSRRRSSTRAPHQCCRCAGEGPGGGHWRHREYTIPSLVQLELLVSDSMSDLSRRRGGRDAQRAIASSPVSVSWMSVCGSSSGGARRGGRSGILPCRWRGEAGSRGRWPSVRLSTGGRRRTERAGDSELATRSAPDRQVVDDVDLPASST